MADFALRAIVIVLSISVPVFAQEKTKLDLDGQPLPERAIARLGSTRPLLNDSVQAVALSPDGKRFASCGYDGILIREWPGGKVIKSTSGAAQKMRSSPDGRFLAINTGERFFDIETEAEYAFDEGLTQPVFFRKSNRAAWIESAEMLCIKTLAKKGEHQRIERKNTLLALAIDALDNLLAAELERDTIRVVRIPDDKLITQVPRPKAGITAVELSLDARKLIILAKDGELRRIDLATGKADAPLAKIAGASPPFAVSADGARLFLQKETLQEDRVSYQRLLWNIDKADFVPSTLSQMARGAFSGDGHVLVTAGIATALRAPMFWDTTTGKRITFGPGHSAPRRIVFSSDGTRAFTALTRGYNDPFLWVWDAETGKPITYRTASRNGIADVAIAADGKHAAVTEMWDQERDVVLWDLVKLEPIRHFKGHRYGVVGAALSSDGKVLVTQGSAGSNAVIVWDTQTGKSIAEHPALGGGGGTGRVSLLPDERTILVHDHGELRFWNYVSGRQSTIEIHADASSAPVGWLIAVTTPHGTQVVETLTGKPIWRGPNLRGGHLALAPDGRTIAFGQEDGKVMILDWLLGKAPLTFQACERGPLGLCFSLDGTRLSGADRDSVLLWDVADLVKRPLPPPGKPTDAEVDAWCRRLAADDASDAYQAAWKLIAVGDAVVPKLAAQLRPKAGPGAAQIAKWIAELDSKTFLTRDRAQKELTKLGDDVLTALKEAGDRARSLEQRRRIDDLREILVKHPIAAAKAECVRGLFVLEQIGSPAARKALQSLAAENPDAFVSSQASRTLERLALRDGAR